MKCLIIAAGKGKRLSQRGDSKPLIPFLGVPLIERVIRSVIKAGIDDFCVVTGYNGEKVRHFLDGLARRSGITVTHIINEEWEKDNGLSVLKAKKCIDENFILLMSDHLFDPDILHDLTNQSHSDGEITLIVDRNINNVYADIEDVTRVMVENGKVTDINKKLEPFNGFDTGLFLCSPGIFDALELSIEEHGDSTLSGGVRELALRGKVNALDIGERFWFDIDDSKAMDMAEHVLLSELGGKSNDGPVSRYLNRPISIRISRYLSKTSISPNHISIVSFVLSLLAAGLFVLGGYTALLSGGLVAQFASIIDGCDGEVARIKYMGSSFGGWFDAVLDRYADAFLLFGLTWHALAGRMEAVILAVGFLALIGSFMLSYTADKYDSLMRSFTKLGKSIRIGRDMRIFIIFIGALLNKPFIALLIIAILMNAETVRRVIVCRHYE